MEERPTGRFLNRSEHELHATAVGRRMWQRVRPLGRSVDRGEPRQQGPYETSYAVAHGYSAERSILFPGQ